MDSTKTTMQGNCDNAFPSRLRKLMEDNSISQQKLADHLGLKNRQSVASYCNGRSAPDLESIVKIASFFSVSTDYLLGATPDPSPVPSAVEDLGLTPKAVQYLRALHELAKVPPYETDRLSLISYLLGHKNFDWFLVQCILYVKLKNQKTDTSFWQSPDYDFCEDTLESHGYTISTPEIQACAIFSEEIIPKFRALLTEASELWEASKLKGG